MATTISSKLATAFSQFARRYAPAFITLIILAGAFFYYTHVIMEKNRVHLLGRSFRGLQSIGGNIREKLDVYTQRNSQNFLEDMARKGENSADASIIEQQYGLTSMEDTSGAEDAKGFTLTHLDGWKIIFSRKGLLKARAPVKDFVQSFLRRDLFQHYFLAHDERVVFDELNLSHDSMPAIGQGREVRDTATGQMTMEYSMVQQVEAGGKKYKLFMLPFTVQGTHRFVIGGYMPLEDYDAQCKKIIGITIMWLVLGIVMVVLMFPLLRIFLMNRAERLNPGNVLNSLMSVHMLGSILVIILVNIYVYWGFIKPQADNELMKLAESMQQTFSTEVKDALDEITQSEQELLKIASQRTIPGNSTPLFDLYGYSPDDTTYQVLKTIDGKREKDSFYRSTYLGKYPYFEHIIWADSTGRQIIRWTNKSMVPRKINVRERDYFQAVMQGSLFRSGQNEYFLTAINSWVAKEKLVSIARRSRLQNVISGSAITSPKKEQLLKDLSGIKVVSLNTPLRSIFNPILPYGYGFCIINDAGDVLFHNDINRSLNENLLKECDDDIKLGSLLNTNTSGYFDASYSGSSTRFYVSPIMGMPYYMITYYNIENNWNQDLDIVSATSILVLLNMGVILLLILITRMLNLKLLSKAVFFIWLEPKVHRTRAYGKVSVAFLAVFFSLLSFGLFSRVADGLYLLGVSLGFAYIMVMYSYCIYSYYDWKKREERHNTEAKVDRKISVRGFVKNIRVTLFILPLVYLVAGIIFFVRLNEEKYIFLFSQLGFLLLLLLLNHRGTLLNMYSYLKNIAGKDEKTSEKNMHDELPAKDPMPGSGDKADGKMKTAGEINADEEQKFKRNYHYSLYSFILATAIAPTLLFFILSFKEEQTLVLKYQQLDFMNTFLYRKPFDYYRQEPAPRLSYHFPVYHNYVADTIIWDKSMGILKKTNTHFNELYSTIKPSFSSYAKRIEYLSDTMPGRFAWDTKGLDVVEFRMDVTRSGTFAKKDNRVFVSKKLPGVIGAFFQQDWKSVIVQLLLLIVFIFVFLAALRRLLDLLIRHVFFFDKPTTSPLQILDKGFIAKQHEYFKTNHMFVLGIINSGKYNKIHEVLEFDTKNPNHIELDFATMMTGDKVSSVFETGWGEMVKKLKGPPGDDAKSENKLVVIRYFDTRMNDFLVSEEKLKRMEELLSFEQVRVVISSCSHFDNMIIKEEDADGKEKDLSGRWANMMSNFTVFYHKWSLEEEPEAKQGQKENPTPSKDTTGAGSNKGKNQEEIDKDRLIKLLERKFKNECMHSAFLYSLLKPLRQSLRPVSEVVNEGFAGKKPPDKIVKEQVDVFCLKLQTLAHYYYLSLWQSLTPQDQLTLYDVACDGLMNQRNVDVAENLHALGMLDINRNKTGYWVMNESFRRFVLTRIDKKEINMQRSDADASHSWNRFQLPVIMVVIAVSLFLFTTQKDAFNNLVAYLGAAAAVVTGLLKALDVNTVNKPTGT